jgi:uncharacterized membrane protein
VNRKVKFLGHPVHQMLIVFPLGLLATALIFDLLHLVSGNGYWSEIAFWMMIAGIAGGLAAAPFGLFDWLSIPAGTRAKRVGAVHGLGNAGVLAVFALSAWLRRDDPRAPEAIAYVLSFAGGLAATVTGWLGGELVNRLGVGIDAGANVDAPSSLTTPEPVSHPRGSRA